MSLKEDTGNLLPNKRDNSAVHSIKNKDITDQILFSDGWITECRESSRKLISPKNREKILSFRKRKFQSEGNQFLSRQILKIEICNIRISISNFRLTFPWTRSSSTGRIRRPAAGDSSTRGLSSTTAPCTTSDLQSVR